MTHAPRWTPHIFNILDPDGPGLDPAAELPLLIADLMQDAARTPDWRIDDEPGSTKLVRLSAPTGALVAFVFDHPDMGHLEGAIALSPDPSGWLRVDVAVGGALIFRAFADRPYEEYELWPPGAVSRMPEPPGRMGKKRNWLSLHADAWPQLRPAANAGSWVNLMAMDYVTVFVRLLGGDVGEGVDVWRPARAVPADLGFELIAPETHDPEVGRWEFPPGSFVRCEMRSLSGSDEVVVVERLA